MSVWSGSRSQSQRRARLSPKKSFYPPLRKSHVPATAGISLSLVLFECSGKPIAPPRSSKTSPRSPQGLLQKFLNWQLPPAQRVPYSSRASSLLTAALTPSTPLFRIAPSISSQLLRPSSLSGAPKLPSNRSNLLQFFPQISSFSDASRSFPRALRTSSRSPLSRFPFSAHSPLFFSRGQVGSVFQRSSPPQASNLFRSPLFI